MFPSTFLLVFITIQASLCLDDDYYWREYTGTIPDDALVGGQDINNKNVYIGQAYVHNEGLIVSEIFPGVREVQAPINGVKTVKSYIKILCGAQQNFYWAQANASHLHVQMIDKRPIIGGHEVGGILNIGRISYEGDIKIGKVISFRTESALLHFNVKGTEKGVSSYEILLFNDNAVDVRLGK